MCCRSISPGRRVSNYLTGKLYAYLAVAGAIYVVPQILLHLGLAGPKTPVATEFSFLAGGGI
ncbi:MAG: hypothetical protein ACR2ME_04530 [Acidimicrobiia bacterium]